jgi:autotransporter adhesin
MADEEAPRVEKLCADCDFRPAGFGAFGKYCEECRDDRKAAREAKKGGGGSSSHSRKPSAGGSSLERRIRDSVMMTASIAAISDPRIYQGVEQMVDQFAVAWANVAKENPTAGRYIEALLTGGVWLTALGATFGMWVCVMLATGKLPQRFAPVAYQVWPGWFQEQARQAAQQPEPAPGNDPIVMVG